MMLCEKELTGMCSRCTAYWMSCPTSRIFDVLMDPRAIDAFVRSLIFFTATLMSQMKRT